MNYIGITKTDAEKVAKTLNKLLAAYSIHYQNLRSHHWNITGTNFFELHKIFEDLYNDAKLQIDEIAERILTLGIRPTSKFSEYLSKSSISEAESGLDDKGMVQNVLNSQKELISLMRTAINAADKVGDESSADLITAMVKEEEKRTWMLSSWMSSSSKTRRKV